MTYSKSGLFLLPFADQSLLLPDWTQGSADSAELGAGNKRCSWHYYYIDLGNVGVFIKFGKCACMCVVVIKCVCAATASLNLGETNTDILCAMSIAKLGKCVSACPVQESLLCPPRPPQHAPRQPPWVLRDGADRRQDGTLRPPHEGEEGLVQPPHEG